MWKHRLRKLDTKNRTAICSNCGPVKIKIKRKPNNVIGWRCYDAVKLDAKREPYKYTYKPYSYRGGKLERPIKACAICESVEKLVWDHDHKTGEFRGWLCRLCNSALEMMKDSPKILQSAIKYLEMTRATR